MSSVNTPIRARAPRPPVILTPEARTKLDFSNREATASRLSKTLLSSPLCISGWVDVIGSVHLRDSSDREPRLYLNLLLLGGLRRIWSLVWSVGVFGWGYC